MTIEQSYLHYLELTGSPEAAATLVLAASRTEPEWLTAKELANKLGISVSSVYRRVSDGTLPEPTRCGRLVRWRNDGLDIQT